MSLLKKCPKCNTYTFKDTCPKCNNPNKNSNKTSDSTQTQEAGYKFRERFVKK